MGVQITIPDSITQAIRLPEAHLQESLQLEIAVALYAQDALSFGKARELAGLSRMEFSRLLERRNIARHYDQRELEDDLHFARGQ